jgi:membrane-associated phospholipid phosphatase
MTRPRKMAPGTAAHGVAITRAVGIIVAVAAGAAPATADDLGFAGPQLAGEPAPTWEALLPPRYLWDGGAAPFVWGAITARLLLDRTVTARATPLGFSADEGGAARAAWEVPGWTVTAAGAAVAVAIGLGGDDARWFHAKGLAETLATGTLLTGALKLAFGRHRPDFDGDPEAGFGGGNRSFPSGHATEAFEIATYAALYLRDHRLARRRSGVTWWQGTTYAGVYAGAALIAAERVIHHRHHVSDVVAGAALGTATAAVFYGYQERRYRAARAAPRRGFMLAPWLSDGQLGLELRSAY